MLLSKKKSYNSSNCFSFLSVFAIVLSSKLYVEYAQGIESLCSFICSSSNCQFLDLNLVAKHWNIIISLETKRICTKTANKFKKTKR